jgi:predicted nucleic-acid-binding Zn-ribbon protein
MACGPATVENGGMSDDSDETAQPNLPTCPICGHREYRREKGKLDSEWGVTAHRVDMLICTNCGYVLLFYEGNTIFDFD